MADTKITALPAQTTPALEDLVPTVDDPSGTPITEKLTWELGGGLMSSIPGGRLTLETGVPVSITDQTAKTTLYYTPYIHDKIALFNGTAWELMLFSEISIAVPATTAQMYDIWAYDNSGTVALEVLTWTNDTTRATALAYQDGVLCKTGALTRRYLGSFRTTGVSGQTEDSDTKRFLWNYYNRIIKRLHLVDTTVHGYTTGSFRSWNNDATVRVEMIIGVSEDAIQISVDGTTVTGTGTKHVGIGIDTTASQSVEVDNYSASRLRIGRTLSQIVAVGYHYLQVVELGSASASFRIGGVNARLLG